MSDEGLAAVDSGVLSRLDAVLDEIAGLDLDARSDDEILALWQGLEIRRNRLAPIDHQLIAQAGERHLPARYGARSVAMLARASLRLGAGEARARVKATGAAGPRRTLGGLPLEPTYPAVAAGQADGTISPAAARVITDTLDKLPTRVEDDAKTWAEEFLADQAGQFDTDTLRGLSVRVTDTLDPDGLLHDHEHRRTTRDLGLHIRRDGSSQLRGELTAELTEHLRVLFDSLAAPAPATDGAHDDRAPGQRRHDALLDAIKRLERADALPDTGGISATLLLTMTTDAYLDATTSSDTSDDTEPASDEPASDPAAGEAPAPAESADTTAGAHEHGDGTAPTTEPTLDNGDTDADESAAADTPAGPAADTTLARHPFEPTFGAGHGTSGPYRLAGHRLARTGHGVLLPPAEALRWAGGDARYLPITFDRLGRVTAYGHAQRLFTQGQRLAMAARDLGCCFPGCDVPPAWCEAHHITPFAQTRRTSIDDGCLLCGFHHREFERLGWTCIMIHSVPHWIPPWWVDSDQIPIRNSAHNPVPATP